jgi:hypothetical protein
MNRICAQCKDQNNAVTVDNGISAPDADGNIVTLHDDCTDEWILKQVKRPSSSPAPIPSL